MSQTQTLQSTLPATTCPDSTSTRPSETIPPVAVEKSIQDNNEFSGGLKLWKTHTEEEKAILKEYCRITNRENLTLKQTITHIFLDTRSNTAFVLNICCFLFTVYVAGIGMVLKLDLFDVLSAYLFADLLSGLVHIYLDHSKIKFDGSYADWAKMGFQVHHLYPTFHWLVHPHYQPYMECNTIFPNVNLVAMINALTFQLPVLAMGCLFTVSFQATHYYAHARTHNKKVPFVVERLQDLGVILHPRGHQIHHTTYNTDFCILNGYMNWVCDWFVVDEKRLNSFLALLDGSQVYGAMAILSFIGSWMGMYSLIRWTAGAMWLSTMAYKQA